MLNPPSDAPELKAEILKRCRSHPALADFVRPISAEFANLVLARTVLLGEYVDELILHCQESDTLPQLRAAVAA